jgi:hypothetical protein
MIRGVGLPDGGKEMKVAAIAFFVVLTFISSCPADLVSNSHFYCKFTRKDDSEIFSEGYLSGRITLYNTKNTCLKRNIAEVEVSKVYLFHPSKAISIDSSYYNTELKTIKNVVIENGRASLSLGSDFEVPLQFLIREIPPDKFKYSAEAYRKYYDKYRKSYVEEKWVPVDGEIYLPYNRIYREGYEER